MKATELPNMVTNPTKMVVRKSLLVQRRTTIESSMRITVSLRLGGGGRDVDSDNRLLDVEVSSAKMQR
jgi:hypothetical protein